MTFEEIYPIGVLVTFCVACAVYAAADEEPLDSWSVGMSILTISMMWPAVILLGVFAAVVHIPLGVRLVVQLLRNR